MIGALCALRGQSFLTLFRRNVAFVPGLMSDYPLALPAFLWRAERLFPDKKIINNTSIVHSEVPYGEFVQRCRKIGGVLNDLGIGKNARVGTFAWNSSNHLDLWYGVPCSGRVLHTLNIRLFPEQLNYVINHAEDEIIFADKSLLGLLWPHIDTLKTVRHIVVMDDGKGKVPDDPRILHYHELMRDAKEVNFDVQDEQQAASMCYTSGTTGHPKGVVYTHRSLFLHTMALTNADGLGIRESDTILPVVPMFHANAWGLAHVGPACGANLVMPGLGLSSEHLANVIECEKVTIAAGVPTIWMGVLPHLKGRHLPHLRGIPCGGSAVPLSLSKQYHEITGMHILQAWGMTETSPLGTTCNILSKYKDADEAVHDNLRETIGYPILGIETRIIDQQTKQELPWDGIKSGELQVRGPWVCSAYYNPDDLLDEAFTDDWLHTGDVATISPDGYVKLVDRAKDVIKSGGEWISSADVENIIMSHPKVKEAAVIAVKSAKWMERPMACIVVRDGEVLSEEELLDYIRTKMAKSPFVPFTSTVEAFSTHTLDSYLTPFSFCVVASSLHHRCIIVVAFWWTVVVCCVQLMWWLPDRIEFIEEVPKTSVGKFSKKDLRARFHDVVVP
eukprot:gene6193-7417_t